MAEVESELADMQTDNISDISPTGKPGCCYGLREFCQVSQFFYYRDPQSGTNFANADPAPLLSSCVPPRHALRRTRVRPANGIHAADSRIAPKIVDRTGRQQSRCWCRILVSSSTHGSYPVAERSVRRCRKASATANLFAVKVNCLAMIHCKFSLPTNILRNIFSEGDC